MGNFWFLARTRPKFNRIQLWHTKMVDTKFEDVDDNEHLVTLVCLVWGIHLYIPFLVHEKCESTNNLRNI